MKKIEAYSILKISEDATEQEIKKAYRKLAAKYHPDVCKDVDADQKFKDITEAYKILTSDEPEIETSSINDIFNFVNSAVFSSINSRKRLNETLYLLQLTFKESVLGCKKEISTELETWCSNCSGVGRIINKEKKCEICKGLGTISKTNMQGRNFFTMQTPCHACKGFKFASDIDQVCQGTGKQKQKFQSILTIPPATPSGRTFDHRSLPLKIEVKVIPDARLTLDGADVIENLSISLLEGLAGCQKDIEVINGNVISLQIPPLSKHKDMLNITGFGAPTSPEPGNHILILNITYPENYQDVIKLLSSQEINAI